MKVRQVTMFRQRKQLRRWATRLLCVWLFGAAAGVANACLGPSLDELGALRSAVGIAVAGAHGKHAAQPGDTHHGTPQSPHAGDLDHGGTLSKSNCQDFCDKSTVSIPPLKSALDDGGGKLLAPPAVSTAFPIPHPAPQHALLRHPDGALAPPIPIAFLRLAL